MTTIRRYSTSSCQQTEFSGNRSPADLLLRIEHIRLLLETHYPPPHGHNTPSFVPLSRVRAPEIEPEALDLALTELLLEQNESQQAGDNKVDDENEDESESTEDTSSDSDSDIGGGSDDDGESDINTDGSNDRTTSSNYGDDELTPEEKTNSDFSDESETNGEWPERVDQWVDRTCMKCGLSIDHEGLQHFPPHFASTWFDHRAASRSVQVPFVFKVISVIYVFLWFLYLELTRPVEDQEALLEQDEEDLYNTEESTIED